METKNETFEIVHNETRLTVEPINLPGQVLFRINFTNNKLPLVICRAKDINQLKFWTSVPEGRQQDAEIFGPLIEKYYSSKQP